MIDTANHKYNLSTTLLSAHAQVTTEFFLEKSKVKSLFVVDMVYYIGAAFINKEKLFAGATNKEMELSIFGSIVTADDAHAADTVAWMQKSGLRQLWKN